MRSRLWLLPFLLAVLVAGAWWFGFRAESRSPELPVYVQGGERLAAGEEIYRRGTDAKPFTYPPFAAVPFVPFRLLPGKWQPAAWFVVNFLLLLAMLEVLHAWSKSAWPGSRPPRLRLLWLFTALIAGRHVASVFENQSHDLLVAAPLVFGAALWNRGGRAGSVLAGVAAGVGAALKATPLLFLELFVVRRAWWAIAAVLATFALLSFAPDLLWPRLDHGSWVRAWYDVNLRGLAVGGTAAADGAWNAHSILNQSLSGTLTRLCSEPKIVDTDFVRTDVVFAELSPGVLRALILVAQLAVIAAIAWGVLRARRCIVGAAVDVPAAQRRFGLGECGLILCGMVLLSPQSSKAHFCVLLVPAVFCVDRLLRGGRRDPLLLVLVAIAAVFGTGTAKDVLGKNVGNFVLGLGAVTWATVALLLATVRALRDEAASRESRAPHREAAT